MNIKQIECVIEISNTLSFSKAAKNLYLSQPALSAAIKKLEQELGADIFNRKSHSVELTNFGIQFINYAKPLYSDFIKMKDVLKGLEYAYKRPLNVSSFPLKFVYNEFVSMYKIHNPHETTFEHKEHNNIDDIISDLISHRCEIGIVVFSSFQSAFVTKLFTTHNLSFHQLSIEMPHFLVSPHNPYYHTTAVALPIEAMSDYMYISSYDGWFKGVSQNAQLNKIVSNSNIKISNRACLYDLIQNSDAFSISSNNANAYHDAPAYENIRAIPITDSEFHFEIGYLYRKNSSLSSLAKEFIQRIIDVTTHN